ncbi:MAG: aminoacyl-histidine dipeptidase [Bacteroidia bacterium]|nr:aminoacyl-histidine dipeptidase [Bacteroidia bacterium]
MAELESLQPQPLWNYFEQICHVPRPSRKEARIIEYLTKFATGRGLKFVTDNSGNVLISKPATPGMENRKTVILQSHVDMVGESDPGVIHDFEKDPIYPVIQGEWVRSKKATTLGADDGIGIAAQIALLVSDDIAHGPVECLFTVDEETGMTGAFGLSSDILTGNILINLDSEDEGELFIGCAGGKDTLAGFTRKIVSVPTGSMAFKIDITGLTGGHSGDDINKGRANSIKLLNNFLSYSFRNFELNIHSITGGDKRNAIPRNASAIFTIPSVNVDKLLSYFEYYKTVVRKDFQNTDPNISLLLEEAALPSEVIDRSVCHRLIQALEDCPHGVIAMSRAISGLVETSTNLASVKLPNANTIEVATSQRSSVDSSLQEIANRVKIVFESAGAGVQQSQGYPGWAPNPDSEIVRITVSSYKKLFGIEPQVKAIHAGLECGLLLQKYPTMDMISIGPTLKDVHTPSERLHIGSVSKFWLLLLDVLKNIPVE